MNLNSTEWSQAQELLLKLVEVLTPLTSKGEEEEPIYLHKPFFIPPKEAPPFKYTVRLLVGLQSVQKEFAEWVDEMGPVQKPPSIQKEEPLPLLPLQAQKLILQVQQAIATLCNSTNLKAPKEEPLKQIFKELKPEIDQIVEVVTHAPPEKIAQKIKLSFSTSQREQAMKKWLAEKELPQTPSLAPFIIPLRALAANKRKKRKKGRDLWANQEEDGSNLTSD